MDKNKKEIARRSKNAEGEFPLIANVGRNCRIAVLLSFDDVTYGVFNSMGVP